MSLLDSISILHYSRLGYTEILPHVRIGLFLLGKYARNKTHIVLRLKFYISNQILTEVNEIGSQFSTDVAIKTTKY